MKNKPKKEDKNQKEDEKQNEEKIERVDEKEKIVDDDVFYSLIIFIGKYYSWMDIDWIFDIIINIIQYLCFNMPNWFISSLR